MDLTLSTGRKIIHVNRQFIAKNAKDGGKRPVYTVKCSGKTYYARSVSLQGPAEMVADTSQLSCGARAWVETSGDVVLKDAMTFAEAKVSVE